MLGSHWLKLSILFSHWSAALDLLLSPLIPPASSSSVGPMSVSTKTMTYLLGLQLTASSASSLVTSALR